MQYSTAQFRKNLKIEIDGEPFVIVEATHVKPGKGVAFVKTKYKSLISGNVLEKNFRSGDKVETPNLEERKMSYLDAYAADHGGRLAGFHDYIDLRFDHTNPVKEEL